MMNTNGYSVVKWAYATWPADERWQSPKFVQIVGAWNTRLFPNISVRPHCFSLPTWFPPNRWMRKTLNGHKIGIVKWPSGRWTYNWKPVLSQQEKGNRWRILKKEVMTKRDYLCLMCVKKDCSANSISRQFAVNQPIIRNDQHPIVTLQKFLLCRHSQACTLQKLVEGNSVLSLHSSAYFHADLLPTWIVKQFFSNYPKWWYRRYALDYGHANL